MVYEDTAERHHFDSFCKVVLRHAMLDCFREFSCQNKWLVSLNHLPQPIVDRICTTDQYPSDYITFSADGYKSASKNSKGTALFSTIHVCSGYFLFRIASISCSGAVMGCNP